MFYRSATTWEGILRLQLLFVELERAHRMLLTNLPCKHIIIQMNFDDEVALHNFTTKMIVQAIRNFFIVASTENAGKFLEEVSMR